MKYKIVKNFQRCRKLIAEELAIYLIIDIKIVKAAELKIKLGFNQLDPVKTKQQSMVLRIRKTFPNDEIIEDFYIQKLDCMIDFYLPKRKLVIEVDELGHEDRKENKENKRQKELGEHLKFTFTRINPDEKDFSAYDGLGRVKR